MILRLGNAELLVTDLIAARDFYVEVLGLLVAYEDKNQIFLRGVDEFDLWTLTLTRSPHPGLGNFGLRVSDPDELERLDLQHKELDVPVKRVSGGNVPGLGDSLRVRTPSGHPVAFYFDMEQISTTDELGRTRLPMRQTHLRRGIAPTRIDHMNLRVPDMRPALDYWCGTLNFSISEFIERDGETFAAWTRRKTGSHDVALLGGKEPALHHIAYYLEEPAAVFRAADILSDAGFQDSIEFGPGRHGVSNAMFLYIRDPSGNRVELFFGDYNRDLDCEPIGWGWDDFLDRGRLWWSRHSPESFAETTPVRTDWP